MSLKCGLIGLPNVGKSTLFNALTSSRVEASNYPFCTIDPNIATVAVPDRRLDAIAKIVKPKKTIPTTIEFVDIAGLVSGASRGEGLGNLFLSHIREAEAILHVVRCFENDNITHVSGRIDPLSDMTLIHTELALADLDMLQKATLKLEKNAKRGDPIAKLTQTLFQKLQAFLNNGQSLRHFPFTEKDETILKPYPLLTKKPTLYIANTAGDDPGSLALLQTLLQFAQQDHSQALPIAATLEAELAELPPEEQSEFLDSLGLKEPGLHSIIRAAYTLLSCITFFTAGPQEVRAWICPQGFKAHEAAGIIHSDFQKHFIRAEVISYEDFIQYQGEQGAKEHGKWRLEGKDYTIVDGDVIYFRTSA